MASTPEPDEQPEPGDDPAPHALATSAAVGQSALRAALLALGTGAAWIAFSRMRRRGQHDLW